MAEIRFNYGDKFTQTSDSNTGIGSTIPAAKLDISGGTSAGSLRVTGIATLSSVSGFVNTKLTTSTQDIIVEAGQSGSVSGEVVVSAGQTISVSTGATTGQGGIQSLKVYETFMPPVGVTADRPTDVKPGMVYYNKDFKTIEFWDGNFWKQVDNTTTSGRAVFGGGDSNQDIIDFFNISTQGKATSFGEIAGGTSRQRSDACSSATRGLIMAGYSPSMETDIDYITLAAEGNSIKFGDLTDGGGYMPACLSSSTRGIKAGGIVSPATINTIQYVEINTLGDGVDFGDLTTTNTRFAGCSSPVKGLFGGGYNQGSTDPAFERVDEITIASKGNAVSFRNLDRKADALCSSSNHVTGIWAGGTGKGSHGVTYNDISFISIASGGNAIHFGDLMRETNQAGATGSQTRALIAGGGNPTVPETVFVEYSSLGNAMDFGELTAARRFVGGMSDSHGGLGGF